MLTSWCVSFVTFFHDHIIIEEHKGIQHFLSLFLKNQVILCILLFSINA